MSQTITRSPALDAPIVPQLLEQGSYSASAEVRNQLLPIPGGGLQAALFPAGPRAGVMRLLFAARADAFAAFEAHRAAGVFTLTDTDVPEASMSYVVADQLSLQPAEDGDLVWAVSVGFQELE